MFKMVEKIIKQMKRLQNPTIVDDDTIDLEDIEHQSENENTIGNHPNQKREENIKKMFIKVMTIHELLAKKLLWSKFEKNTLWI